MFAVLLDAGGPVAVGEVVAALHADGVTTGSWAHKPPNRVIADMLAYQVRAGRVRRTDRATYEVIQTSMSRSTQRRCRQWRTMMRNDL